MARIADAEPEATDEVEISPEMIEAGRGALARWLDAMGGFEGWPGTRDEDALMSSLFREMRLASRGTPKNR